MPDESCGKSTSLIAVVGRKFSSGDKPSWLVSGGRIGKNRVALGDGVGVVRITSPSDIRWKSIATWLPLILACIRPLPQIRQKKFSSRLPTSLAMRFLLVE